MSPALSLARIAQSLKESLPETLNDTALQVVPPDSLTPPIIDYSDPFESEPVPLDVFLHDSGYLHLPPLSPLQKEVVERASNIYPQGVNDLLGLPSSTEDVLVALWGKGAGKDFVSRLAILRVIYKLLCLKSPQSVYGMDLTASIDAINMAYNSYQARAIFFNPLIRMLEASPWFQNRFNPTIRTVEFDKALFIHSGNSAQESFEGFNPMIVVLDEIDAFRTAEDLARNGGWNPEHSAQGIFNSLRSSVQSRFPGLGKIMLISFLRRPEGFMMDQVKKGKQDSSTFVSVAATWEVNPLRTRADFDKEFERDPDDALQRYACTPRPTSGHFFRNREALYEVFHYDQEKERIKSGAPINPFQDGAFLPSYHIGEADARPRYIHIDIGVTNDSAGIASVHIDHWKEVEGQQIPIIAVDFYATLDPLENGEISIESIRDVIRSFRKRRAAGVNLGMVSFDQFQCASVESLIPTGRGEILLKDIVVGDIVQSRIGPRPVEKIFSYGVRPTLCLTTKEGDSFEGTYNHKIEVRVKSFQRDGGPVQSVWAWKRLDQLKVGDIVHLCEDAVNFEDRENYSLVGDKSSLGWRRAGGRLSSVDGWEFPSKMTPELAEVLGLVWGDGGVTEDSVEVLVTGEELEDAKLVFKRCFRVDPNAYPIRDLYLVSISARWICRWLELNEITKPQIPRAILESSRLVQRLFLRALFGTDGSASKSEGSCAFSTKYYRVARQVQMLLRTEFGIASSIHTCKRGYKGDYLQEGKQYQVCPSGSRRKFYEEIGFSYSRKMEILSRNLDRLGRRKFSRISSIVASESEVRDLQITDDPSYVANGFISHNSKDSMQILASEGVPTSHVSVDKDESAYSILKEIIYDRRLISPGTEIIPLQLRGLIYDKKGKVDHPAVGYGKDTSDALAGAVTNLYNDIYNEDGYEPLADASWVEEAMSK